MALYCIISEILPNSSGKSQFFIPVAFDAPISGVSSEYYHPVWCKKQLEWWGYPTVKKVKIYLAVLTDYRHVTDGQSDGQTDILRR